MAHYYTIPGGGRDYSAPTIETLHIAVEKGFAATGEIVDYGPGGETGTDPGTVNGGDY